MVPQQLFILITCVNLIFDDNSMIVFILDQQIDAPTLRIIIWNFTNGIFNTNYTRFRVNLKIRLNFFDDLFDKRIKKLISQTMITIWFEKFSQKC